VLDPPPVPAPELDDDDDDDDVVVVEPSTTLPSHAVDASSQGSKSNHFA